MKKLLFIIKNWALYRNYKKRIKGVKMVDLRRQCGYFITVGLLGYDPKKKPHEIPLTSGKVGIYQLLDYKTFRDPSDMIDWATYQFLGYKGMKLIADCTFQEYVKLYCTK